MNKWRLLYCGVLVAALGCTAPSNDSPDNREAFEGFAKKVEAALGVFHDIKVFERDDQGTWQVVTGKYVPVTVNGKTPSEYKKDMPSDRPMILPTQVEGFHGGDGQSAPYSVVGRMPGSNPEVQWVFAVRQYYIKKPTDDNFAESGDMAVIGHHPRTGASVFLQYYDPAVQKSSQVVVSPFSEGGPEFWSPIKKIADEFSCQRCHGAVTFIHTPWVNQVRVREDDPTAEAMVPTDPLGPYFFIDSEEGGLFWSWNQALVAKEGGGHFSKRDNMCTDCHRVAPELIGLNENSTRYAGLQWKPGGFSGFNSFAVLSDGFQTPEYRKLHWMPPLGEAPYVDFYAGQEAIAPNWQDDYGESAAELNGFVKDGQVLPDDPASGASWREAIKRGFVSDTPRPEKQYQTIVVDRPHQDQVGPNQSLWIVDSRMRANTDGDLHQWRFQAKVPASENMLAAPVIYRRKPTVSSIQYEVVFVGTARDYESAGEFVSVQAEGTVQLKQGDYLGVVFTNTGSEPGLAPIPYTEDEWAKLTNSDGTTWLRDGTVTYRLATDEAPEAGKPLDFRDADFRTYSFEFKNKLGVAAGE